MRSTVAGLLALSMMVPGAYAAEGALAPGKPAGVRCVQLGADNRCLLFGQAQRPAVCASLQASLPMCGQTRAQALQWLTVLETQTRPD